MRAGVPGGLAPGSSYVFGAALTGEGIQHEEANWEAARDEAERAEDASTASAVSLLQELIQSCSCFSAHTRILTWRFEQQLQADTSLLFCATVSFVFGNVPHSFCGSWQSSKKKAQRDTAERVRRYLLQRLQGAPGRDLAHAAIDPSSLPEDVVRELWEVCTSGAAGACPEGRCLEWRVEDQGSTPPEGAQPQERFRAMLTFHAHAMPHHFAGSWCASEGAARQDTAERVLWYFGRSSEVFATADAPAESQAEVPLTRLNAPPASHDAEQAVEDRTVLMRVQNALQKAFAKDTPPGRRVWEWSYEPDSRDPQLFRARVDVPCWQRSFLGDWCRGKKLAQRSACLEVKRHLDERLASSSS